jgi:BirA family biotin operon repressor/biotin-[acetyl-CoA-carboxylase] ligase
LDVRALRETLLTPTSHWAALDFFDSVDSTNLEALRRPDPWRVVLTDHQSAGRGRLARQWEAPPCTSIAVSCVVPIGDRGGADRSELGWVPLLAGLAMSTALSEVAGVRALLKWPNDVLAGAADDEDERLRKVCGVLCQSAGDELVVVGAGVNVDQEREELPVDTATSLRLCGSDAPREGIIERYLMNLRDRTEAWRAGGPAMEGQRADYRSRCTTVGRFVDLHQPGGAVVRGTATGVDDQGRLVVDEPRGRRPYAAGVVVHVRAAQPGQ